MQSKPVTAEYSLFSRFARDQIPCLCLPASAINAAKAVLEDKAKHMRKFHDGSSATKETIENGSFKVVHSGFEDPEKGCGYVSDGKTAVYAFGRRGPSHFTLSETELVDGVPVYCVEEWFVLHKIWFTFRKLYTPGCKYANFYDYVLAALTAPEPRKAKMVGSSIANFDSDAWDKESMACLWASIVYTCLKSKTTFHRYQSIVKDVPCAKMAALIEQGHFAVYETNGDDKIWGVNKFMQAFMLALQEKKVESMSGGDDAKFNLMDAIGEVAEGKNQAGDLIKEFLLAIKDMTHDDYVKELEGIQFVKILDDETPSAEEPEDCRTLSEPEDGRTLSEPEDGRTLSEPSLKRTRSDEDSKSQCKVPHNE